jgi:hypothetical protein
MPISSTTAGSGSLALSYDFSRLSVVEVRDTGTLLARGASLFRAVAGSRELGRR